MKSKTFKRVLCAALSATLASSCLIGCKKKDNGGGKSNKDAIVLMTEELNGLYNPFYATAGTDQDVIGLTQIGMLSTDKEGKTVAGDNEATVVKAYKVENTAADGSGDSVYTFVLKNGLKFSDGVPLTINDVMFNIYEYVDPVYSGSSTMYSIKIKGLKQYRTQENKSGQEDTDSTLYKTAAARATTRIFQLKTVYEKNGKIKGSQNSYSYTPEQMKAAIADPTLTTITAGYKNAVATAEEQKTLTDADYRKKLAADYDLVLETFSKELENDYKNAKDAYDLTVAPYAEWKDKFDSEVFKFLLYEGVITPEYHEEKGKKDKTKIDKFNGEEVLKTVTTKEQAIAKVYNDTVRSEFNKIIGGGWGTYNTIRTKFVAEAKDVILHEKTSGSASGLVFPFIEGVRSLGHVRKGSDDQLVSSVEIDGTTYKIASEYNDDGTVKNSDEYAALQITVEGTDPKAIYNFGFTVAPVHYYSNQTVNITENQYGVKWGDYDFQNDVIQAPSKIEVPLGAGPFKATDRNNSDNPTGAGFISGNVVYYKANRNFMFDVKCEKLQMQVTSAANAIDKLASGDLDYIVPQFTKSNSDRLEGMKSQGYKVLDSWQLGYGYIGINAGKVPNVNIRRAIMSAMDTKLALAFYEAGTCKNIDWPMSMESWAYPKDASGASIQNGHPYTQWNDDEKKVIKKIKDYMSDAGVSAGSTELKIRFTIAGASITEHPTYPVFKKAAELLNSCGWDVEVKADSSALTKLATGSLAVWAAAWGSTIDPDMYQVYHKNSTATSVLAWGYGDINDNPSKYTYETGKINQLSTIIDKARTINDREKRKDMYKEAMGYVLDLAVEMPVYQRKNLYAFNSKTVKGFNETVNPYSSPLEKVWELELVK